MFIRHDPFEELDRFNQQVLRTLGGGSQSRTLMAMDASRDEDEVVLESDLPGVAPDAIDLTVERDTITVQATRGRGEGGRDAYLVAERPQGEFRRQVMLGDTVDLERMEARYDQGVLTVRVPARKDAKPRRVNVASGSAEGEAAPIEASTSERSEPDSGDAGGGREQLSPTPGA